MAPAGVSALALCHGAPLRAALGAPPLFPARPGTQASAMRAGEAKLTPGTGRSLGIGDRALRDSFAPDRRAGSDGGLALSAKLENRAPRSRAGADRCAAAPQAGKKGERPPRGPQALQAKKEKKEPCKGPGHA